MYKIVSKEQLNERTFKLEVEAPMIARSQRAGHFAIVRLDEVGERVPFAIADSDANKGTITFVIKVKGHTTQALCALGVGDAIHDVVGPLGRAAQVDNFGTVLCVAGGIGAAWLMPMAKALKAAGNRVVTLLVGKCKESIILEAELTAICDRVEVVTKACSTDGKCAVAAAVERVAAEEHIDKCLAIGKVKMMKTCCATTKALGIPTDVALSTIMVDGTGMCGACRVMVDGKTKYVCVDGPIFDGHQVDFENIEQRLEAYREQEEAAASGHTFGIVQPATPVVSEEAYEVHPMPELKPKDRMAIERVTMPELDAEERVHLFNAEVNLGFTPALAQQEAQRCLHCKKPGCVEGCPVHNNIPGFIAEVAKGDFHAAAEILKQTTSLPAVCGRVCPQEVQCEGGCIYVKTGRKAISIGNLERFVADYEREHAEPMQPRVAPKGAKRVAAIGSGPAGLAFAGDMAKMGYDVTVFEALHEVGGVLKYGIPEFCLPNSIVDHEIKNLEALGVKFVTNCIVGQTISVKELEEQGFEGIFVATGAGLSNFMNIPGENYTGILTSNEYLIRCNLMEASSQKADTPLPMGKNVLVVGGGNTAMDAVRTAIRLGAETATIVYRRSEEEMPARLEERRHAKEEGIRFMNLRNPIEYHADEQGRVKEVVLQKMELGAPDESGRRRPVAIPGATETIPCDLVVVAVGVSPNPIVPLSVDGLKLGWKNIIEVDENMQSNIPTIFAGGDIVRGAATVILAMGDGKRAAVGMDEMLRGK